ncbi:MAG: hypothetical protein FWH38_06820 [Treponema sp.]|nr:hypothetical protein [Treponema sp.]
MKQTVLRGKILDLLKKVYPDGVDEITIVSILYQYFKTEDITASLEYLADKGYTLKKEQPHAFLPQETIRWHKLSPKGIDLVEGSIPADPGILVPRG